MRRLSGRHSQRRSGGLFLSNALQNDLSMANPMGFQHGPRTAMRPPVGCIGSIFERTVAPTKAWHRAMLALIPSDRKPQLCQRDRSPRLGDPATQTRSLGRSTQASKGTKGLGQSVPRHAMAFGTSARSSALTAPHRRRHYARSGEISVDSVRQTTGSPKCGKTVWKTETKEKQTLRLVLFTAAIERSL